MSIEALTTVLHHSTATPTAKLVLTAISWHEGKDPSQGCWPSQETIGKYANLSARQVRRAIDQLVEIGELDVIKNGGPRTGPTPAPNLYLVLLECPETCDKTLAHRDLVQVKNGTGSGQKGRSKRSKMVIVDTNNDLLINNEQTINKRNLLKAI